MKATLITSGLAVGAADLSGAEKWVHLGALLAPLIVAIAQALRKPKKRSHHARKKGAGVVAVASCLLLLAGVGCQKSTFADSVRALSGDTNSWKLDVTCPLGGLKLNRNQP